MLREGYVYTNREGRASIYIEKIQTHSGIQTRLGIQTPRTGFLLDRPVER